MSTAFFEVEGGHQLKGTLQPQGAKNEALQILCAVLLTSEKVRIENVPNILDVNRLIDLLKGLGVQVEPIDENTYEFEATDVDLDYMSSLEYRKDARKIRGSVMLLGPLLARYRKAYLPKPGGDKIGRRRLDTHFLGFEKLGASFEYDSERKAYFIEGKNLKGGYMLMDEISVTGTANVVMAATLQNVKPHGRQNLRHRL